MAKFTKEMINDYANKLYIGLTEEENKMVLDEFEIIDKTCDAVTEIPGIEKVTPMTHALLDFNAELREDVAEESIDINDALSNCDNVDDREVELPKVVG
ncbi:MAG: hypothetical protein E7158_00640 [Firmicutes bacterium]|nr:hypothetical protein [Bacillota bacterium]